MGSETGLIAGEKQLFFSFNLTNFKHCPPLMLLGPHLSLEGWLSTQCLSVPTEL